MGKYEVSFEQYDAFAKATQRRLPDDEGWGRGTRPVINVSWADMQAFIGWLNKQTGRHFRLPSEAEWEYAARGGTTTVYWWGDKFDPEQMNASGTNGRDKWVYTAPVGQFSANPFGLYDVAGNVWERVADCWHSSYNGAPNDGSAWLGKPCYTRVMRGGSWYQSKRPMRSSARAGTGDAMPSMAVGFRLAEDLK
jgi:formylglycine-generating enzyme required for sulfatase activity